MRRTLVASQIIEGRERLLGLDGKRLWTAPSVRDAVESIAHELDKLRQGRGYSEGSGWAVEPPPTGENGINFTIHDVGNGETIVLGQMILRRDD